VLRLRAQEHPHTTNPNRIDPNSLNEVDQRMLKEAFRQARKVQQRLKETFSFAL
jgi:CBS domain-containing protein